MTTETRQRLHVPRNLGNPVELLKFLTKLGFEIPYAATQCAGAGTSLAASGIRVTVLAIDAAMAKFDMDISDRIGVKTHLARLGLLAG
jgi:hypothetical protein